MTSCLSLRIDLYARDDDAFLLILMILMTRFHDEAIDLALFQLLRMSSRTVNLDS
jgi:hypothetical protein